MLSDSRMGQVQQAMPRPAPQQGLAQAAPQPMVRRTMQAAPQASSVYAPQQAVDPWKVVTGPAPGTRKYMKDPNDPNGMSVRDPTYDPNALAAQNVATHGRATYDASNLPAVRVPGVQYNPDNFTYNGVNQNQWNNVAGAAMASQGPQGQWDQQLARGGPQGQWGQANDARGQMQQGLAGVGNAQEMYRQMAMGGGPDLAGMQMQRGVDQSIHAQMAMAGAARGGPMAQAAAMRNAQQQGQQMQMGVAGQAAQMRGQQQLQGMQGYGQMGQAYGGLAGAMRQGDYGQASTDLSAALMGRQQNIGMGQADLSAAAQSRGQNMGFAQNVYQLGANAAQNEMQGRQAYATQQGNSNMATQQANANLEMGHDAAAQQLGMQTASTAASGLAALPAFAALL